MTRTVNVVDTTAPVITLTGANPQDIEVGTAYVELGSTVSDNYDMGWPPPSTSPTSSLDTVGEYTVTYNVTDANGNEADRSDPHRQRGRHHRPGDHPGRCQPPGHSKSVRLLPTRGATASDTTTAT